jgi:hypothetical protein
MTCSQRLGQTPGNLAHDFTLDSTNVILECYNAAFRSASTAGCEHQVASLCGNCTLAENSAEPEAIAGCSLYPQLWGHAPYPIMLPILYNLGRLIHNGRELIPKSFSVTSVVVMHRVRSKNKQPS